MHGVYKTQIAEETRNVTDFDNRVANLHKVCNAVVSHIDADKVINRHPLASTQWLPHDDVEVLLARAALITQKYSLLNKSPVYGQLSGIEDYKVMLGLLRDGLAFRSAKIDG